MWPLGGGPGRGTGGGGTVCLFEWRTRDRVVTSPALPGLAPPKPKAKTSSAWERVGFERWLRARPPPSCPPSSQAGQRAASRGGQKARPEDAPGDTCPAPLPGSLPSARGHSWDHGFSWPGSGCWGGGRGEQSGKGKWIVRDDQLGL